MALKSERRLAARKLKAMRQADHLTLLRPLDSPAQCMAKFASAQALGGLLTSACASMCRIVLMHKGMAMQHRARTM